MDCTTPEGLIACAIRDAARLEWFDYAAYLAVPIFLGIVTLAVAGASWRVARQSYLLSLAIVEDRSQSELNGKKLALADQMFRWSAFRWVPDVPKLSQVAKRHAEIGRLSAALIESGIPGSEQVQDFLWKLDHKEASKKLTPVERSIEVSYRAGAFSRMTEQAIIEWLHRPDGLEMS